MTDGWGPDARRGAIGITFDNLGEAMELATGVWPEGRTVGHHPSVRDTLPKLLDLVGELGLRTTYFAEGWSAGVYPEVLAELVAAGHEVGYHGWRHEHWADVESREREAGLIGRGVAAMRELGIELHGFRPPGGVMTPWTVELSREHGFSYLSPAGPRTGMLAPDLVSLPFAWRAIDAYYAWDAFAPLRRQLGDRDALLPADRMRDAMVGAVERTIAEGGCLTLLFHPFLLGEPARFGAMREVLRFVAGSDEIWIAPCRELAEWVLRAPQRLPAAELDERSWR